MPLAAAPRLDDIGCENVDENLAERALLGIVIEMIGLIVPAERRVEQHRQKQIVTVVDHLNLADGIALRGVEQQLFFGVLRPDVAFQREFARDDFLDRDFLVPARAAVARVAFGLGNVLATAQRAAGNLGGATGHLLIIQVRQVTTGTTGERNLSYLPLSFPERWQIRVLGVVFEHATARESWRDRQD